ncbi:MAG: ATP-binding cassette domain-containing protein [Erysipelotrichaceae bacterium]|nr:ATP-binding cassette domain-containing protein [Erysipelotrichaceae bacterium]
MGWFDEQIKTRKLSDQEILEDSFMKLASAVLGTRISQKSQSQRYPTKEAIDDILKFYHLKPAEIDEEMKQIVDQLDTFLRPHGIMYRSVRLKKGFYKDSIGPILALDKETQKAVALLPGAFSGYAFEDPASGRKEKVKAGNEGRFEEDAYCFYRPLPLKKLNVADLLLYMKDCIAINDFIYIGLMSLAVTLSGMLITYLTNLLTGPVLRSGDLSALYAAMFFMICAGISSRLVSILNAQINSRLSMKTSLSVQAAVMMRILSLPASFFRKYSSGELFKRSSSISQLCDMLLSSVFTGGIASLMSLLYVGQIFKYAPKLVGPSLLIVFLTVGLSVITGLVQVSVSKHRMELSAKESGMSFSLLSGIQKIRVSGSEKRAFARWADVYAKQAAYSYDPPFLIRFKNVITLAVSLFGTIRLYHLAVTSGMDAPSYFAFNSAYAMVMGTFSSLAQLLMSFAQISPVLEMAKPILNEVPEAAEDKEVIKSLSGNIEMSHVSFRYEDSQDYVIDDLSLNIKAGDYVAIVGKTGCGKSTLIRLLLGFETPEKGAVYYDKKDLRKIDPVSLRKKIGTVTQNGDLFSGDIYSNIAICAPGLPMDEAWKAAEAAGIAEDIKAMPMGMFTMISEGARDISGGQKQRLMIARAIAPKPRILIFDEATSALDNKTQKQVSEALDQLKCTRIVIAHRLSTIRHCNRILLLEGGKIIDEGTYEELIERSPFFAELVERQRLDLPTQEVSET